jgi:hypothetical protein
MTTRFEQLTLKQKDEVRRLKKIKLQKKPQNTNSFDLPEWDTIDFLLFLRTRIPLKKRIKNLLDHFLKGKKEISRLSISHEAIVRLRKSAACYLESHAYFSWLINAYAFELIDFKTFKTKSSLLTSKEILYFKIFEKVLLLNDKIQEIEEVSDPTLSSFALTILAGLEEKTGDKENAKTILALIKDQDEKAEEYFNRLSV